MPLRRMQFDTRPHLVKHFAENADCNFQNKRDEISLLKCPNANCNTWRNNRNELHKDLSHRCHLTCEERDFAINDEETKINRKLTKT